MHPPTPRRVRTHRMAGWPSSSRATSRIGRRSGSTAVGVFVDEIRLPALLLRHTARLVFGELVRRAEARARGDGAAVQDEAPDVRSGWGVELAVGDRPAGSLAELFQELERMLLATDASEVRGLWEWNDRLGRDQ